MGLICCVPARSQTTAGSVNGCSNIVDELHCCSTNGFSPPSVSQQWENHENPHTYALQTDRASLSPSSRGSRVGSDRFIRHRHTPSDSVFSHGASPSHTHWASLVSSRSGNFADFITHTGELNSSPSITFNSHKEGVLFTGFSPLSSTPESNESCKQDEYGSNNFIANESRPSFHPSRNKGIDLNLGSMDNTSDWWSVQTFSELVASSRRERLRWTRARSPSDFGYILHRKSMENAASYPVERIRAYSSEAVSVVPCAETHTCGLCSRSLADSSPNSHGIIEVSDLAVVGVLSCGHVFHSRCLEEVTPEARKQDPPCPQCDAADKLKTKKIPELLLISSKSGWMASSFHGQISRNKLSRIVAADNFSERELPCSPLNPKGKIPMHGDICERPESFNSMYQHEKAWSRKLPSKKTFTFKGKTLKDVLIGDGGRKHSGASSQVSPDKSCGDDKSRGTMSIKGRSGSFRILRSW